MTIIENFKAADENAEMMIQAEQEKELIISEQEKIVQQQNQICSDEEVCSEQLNNCEGDESNLSVECSEEAEKIVPQEESEEAEEIVPQEESEETEEIVPQEESEEIEEVEEIVPQEENTDDDQNNSEEPSASGMNTVLIENELSEIRLILKDMNARISSLRKLADMHQEIERNLNEEINQHKDNLYRRIVNPILIELFDIQEDMNAEANDAGEEAAKILKEYISMLTKVFKHYGVTVKDIAVGDAYDSSIHNPVKAVPTNDKSLDKTIFKTRKTMVHFIDDKIVERSNVHVYQYVEESTAEAAESSQNEMKALIIE